MTMKTGRIAEEKAARFLKNKGFVILARNVIYPFGELDLVATQGKTLVFVEVKYRSTSFDAPFEAVSKSKQKKLIKAAHAYLQNFEKIPNCRFDVISLTGPSEDPLIEHLEDAFWEEA